MMKPEPCEFTSGELLVMAEDLLTKAIAFGDPDGGYARQANYFLKQALAQLKHNNGAATPFPEEKDPWAWDDADTYGCSA